MAEKEEDGPKSKDNAEKSVVPVIPKTSEDNIVEKDEKKIEEKCAAKSSKKENVEKSPKSVVSCETPSKNERRLRKRIEKGNLGGRKVAKVNGNSRGGPKGPRKGKEKKTNRRGESSPEPTKASFLLEISPEKLVFPYPEPLEVTVKNPTEDTQTLRCTFDSYYFLVDFKDAKSSGQHGVTPAAAYGCYELGPGESCSMTIRMTDREIDQSVQLETLQKGTYDVKKPFAHLPRLRDQSNIIDIAFYNYDRPEGFLKFQYRKKEKQSNAKWVARTKRLHLTDDIKEIMRLEDEKAKEKEKDKEENETDPNPPEYMKFYRMKWLYKATQRHQKWRASWGEKLRNDDDGTHRVFSVQPDFVVDQFLMDKENYNKTLGTEEDNAAFWGRILLKENIENHYRFKKTLLDRNVGFGKHDFTAETLEESLEKAEQFLEDQRKENLKNYDLHIEQVRMEPEKEKGPEMEQPVKQEEEKTVEKKEENKEEKKKKKKNPCCSIC